MLGPALADPDRAVRLAALQVVGQLEGEARAFLPRLVELREDEDPTIQPGPSLPWSRSRGRSRTRPSPILQAAARDRTQPALCAWSRRWVAPGRRPSPRCRRPSRADPTASRRPRRSGGSAPRPGTPSPRASRPGSRSAGRPAPRSPCALTDRSPGVRGPADAPRACRAPALFPRGDCIGLADAPGGPHHDRKFVFGRPSPTRSTSR